MSVSVSSSRKLYVSDLPFKCTQKIFIHSGWIPLNDTYHHSQVLKFCDKVIEATGNNKWTRKHVMDESVLQSGFTVKTPQARINQSINRGCLHLLQLLIKVYSSKIKNLQLSDTVMTNVLTAQNYEMAKFLMEKGYVKPRVDEFIYRIRSYPDTYALSCINLKVPITLKDLRAGDLVFRTYMDHKKVPNTQDISFYYAATKGQEQLVRRYLQRDDAGSWDLDLFVECAMLSGCYNFRRLVQVISHYHPLKAIHFFNVFAPFKEDTKMLIPSPVSKFPLDYVDIIKEMTPYLSNHDLQYLYKHHCLYHKEETSYACQLIQILRAYDLTPLASSGYIDFALAQGALRIAHELAFVTLLSCSDTTKLEKGIGKEIEENTIAVHNVEILINVGYFDHNLGQLETLLPRLLKEGNAKLIKYLVERRPTRALLCRFIKEQENGIEDLFNMISSLRFVGGVV